MLTAGNAFAQQQVILDNVTNSFDSGNKLIAGQVHVFELRIRNFPAAPCDDPAIHWNTNNGFQISSPDGATWNYTKADTSAAFGIGALGWTQYFINHFNDATIPSVPQGDGMNTNEVQYGGVSFSPNFGLPVGFDDLAYTIEIQSNVGDVGKTICIDTIGVPPIGTWLWAGIAAAQCDVSPEWVNNASTDATAPYCFVVDFPPHFPPEITNCPAAPISGSHCDVFSYNFNATDPEDDPITYILAAGPGSIDANTGLWTWNTATLADVGASIVLKVVAADQFGSGDTCFVNVEVTNTAPTITCPAGPLTVQAGALGQQDVDGADADACDNITFSIANDGGVAGTVSIDPNTGVVSYTPDPADAGLVTMTIEVTDGLATAQCDISWNVILGAPYAIEIGCNADGPVDEYALQGQFYTVPVSLTRNETGIGGFDLLIAYDQSALSLMGVEGADAIAPECWEYFTYRQGASGNCGNGCPSGLIRLIGLEETNNGPAHPAPGCENYTGDLARLTFLVSNDRTLECQTVPIRFFWVDCGDNTVSDPAGALFIHDVIRDPLAGDPGNDNILVDPTPGPYTPIALPGYYGVGDDCLTQDKDSVTRNVDFYNGCIRITCGDEIDARGDININGLAYEIADAVMFTNYFIEGLTAFGSHVDASIAASDANADGLVLTVADLVYLIRVVVGDALPYPKVTPEAAKYTVKNGVLSVDGPTMGAAYVVVRGQVEPRLLATNMDLKYGFDGENTNILVYSLEAQGFTGEFLQVDGELVKIELAAYDGAPVTLTNVPADYELYQNSPNPFNPTTTISFALPQAGDYTLTVYNITGQVVATFEGTADAGVVEVEWDASNLASGVYFYRLTAGEFTATKKAVLLK